MPRSPSRDLADRFDGNRGYFRRPEPTRRGKYLLAGVALVLAVWWAIADVTVPSRSAYSHTHGPVANPHAHWDDNCAACHREHSVAEFAPASVFHARDRWHDLTCEKCHTGAAHNANVNAEGRAFHDRCSNCHHEHNGRENSLVRISDDHCTRCHANLNEHRVTDRPKCETRIRSFTRDHPEFRALTPSPNRTLKFSHALHLTPGQVRVPGGREAMTVDELRRRNDSNPEMAGRYRKLGQGEGDLISLDCTSCHQLDSGASPADYDRLKSALDAAGEPIRSVLPARPAGAHFLPINFEVHCRACHPLRAPDGVSAKLVIPGFDVAHRRQPKDLTDVLKAGYLSGLVKEGHPAVNAPAEPGGLLGPLRTLAARTIHQEVDRLAESARMPLFSDTTNFKGKKGTERCTKCHDLTDSRIVPVPDRTVWLPAARFNHLSHKAVTCLTCHPGTAAAYAPPKQELIEKEPVQIVQIDLCRTCHSPANTRVTLPDGTGAIGGGVRHACVDCHRYHNGDHALEGRGAAALFPEQPLTVSELLRGKKD